VRLLDILDGPRDDGGRRQRLVDKGEAALVPEIFDELAAG
jgi:hypothetical protein